MALPLLIITAALAAMYENALVAAKSAQCHVPVVATRPANSDSNSHLSWKRVQGRALKDLLAQKQVLRPPTSTLPFAMVEEFHKDGRYFRHDDNFEPDGKFKVKGDRVCIKVVSEPGFCRTMFQDSRGDYWIGSGSAPEVRVEIKKL